MSITIKNLHSELPEANLHEAKGFTTASNNTYLKKNHEGSSEWLSESWLQPVKGVVTGSSAPATEVSGDRYILTGSSFHANWDTPAQHEIVEFNGTIWVGIAAVDGMRVADLSDDSIYYFNTAWNQVTDANTDTTYSVSAVDSGSDAIIRLTAGGSGSGTDDITLVAGTNITITPSGDDITLAAAAGGASALDDLSDCRTPASENYGIGTGAIDSISSGDDNIAIGLNAGTAITTQSRNIFIGSYCGDAYAGDNGAIGIGYMALTAATSGQGNLGIGYSAGASTSVQHYNTYLGYQAGRQIDQTGNTAVGFQAMEGGVASAGARYNTAIGKDALTAITTGDNNLALGYEAGNGVTTGSSNTIIGYTADVSATADNQIAIGNGAVTTAADEINIGGNIIGLMTAADKHTKFEGQVYTETHALTDGATITPDFKDGNVQSVTLAGNRTLANPTNLKNGATYLFLITQDGSGSRTLAYGSNFKWEGGTAPTLSTGANAVDILTFVSDGTNMYGTKAQNFS